MPTVADALSANRTAVAEFLGAVDQLGGTWITPRAPGKWTPAQVTEHVARAYDESAKLFAGQAALFPTFPWLLRPVVRGLLFNRVVRTGRFPKAKTNRPMNPVTGPPTPAEGRARLERALATFEQQAKVTGAAGDARVRSATFGEVRLTDWVRFQECHARHHQAQLRPRAG